MAEEIKGESNRYLKNVVIWVPIESEKLVNGTELEHIDQGTKPVAVNNPFDVSTTVKEELAHYDARMASIVKPPTMSKTVGRPPLAPTAPHLRTDGHVHTHECAAGCHMGGYYEKYLKYKQKYLNLKNQFN
jgi:hypothetical protein